MPTRRIPVARPPTIALLLAAFGLFATISLVPRDARAGAWAQKDKSIYIKLAGAHSWAQEQYKAGGGEPLQLLSANEDGSVRSSALRIYGEFGVLPRLTYIASTSIMASTVESDIVRITTTGLADFTNGLKYQFLDKPVVASVSTMFTTPTGYTSQPENPKVPTLGLGIPTYTANLLIGKSFYPLPLYASGQVGYRLRGSRPLTNGSRIDYPPEIPYAAEVGFSATDRLLIRGALQGLHGLGDPEDLNFFSLSPKTQSYIKAGPSIIYTLKKHFQFNVDYLYTFTGVNAIKGHTLSAGVAVDYGF